MSGFGKVLVAAVAGASMLSGAAIAQTKFRSSDTHPDGYPTVEAVKYMGEVLKKETNGRLMIEVFHSSQLGEEKDTIQQTQFGVIDLNRVSAAPLNNIVPETRVLAMPFLFRSVDHMHKVVDGPIGDDILKALEPHNMIGLALYDAGARSVYNSKHAVKTPADMKGLKIRVQQSDVQLAMISAMGGNPTPMPYGEVYSGLQTRVIDGAENNWPSYQNSRHFEQAKFFSLTEHSMLPEILMMSKKVWDKQTPEDQALIKKAAKESVIKMRELWMAKEKESEEVVRKAGSQINEVDKGAFTAAMNPVYEKFVNNEAKLKDLVERIRAVQ